MAPPCRRKTERAASSHGVPPARHPDSPLPAVIPAGTPLSRHPGRSEAESRTNARSALNSRRLTRRVSEANHPWAPGRLQRRRLRQAPHGSRIKSGMTGFWVVIPAGANPLRRHPGRSEAESRDPAGAGQASKVRGFAPAPHGSRIKSGMTGFWVVIPAGAEPPHRHPGRSEAESRDPPEYGRASACVASPAPRGSRIKSGMTGF
jgi:hypothetical protein